MMFFGKQNRAIFQVVRPFGFPKLSNFRTQRSLPCECGIGGAEPLLAASFNFDAIQERAPGTIQILDPAQIVFFPYPAV